MILEDELFPKGLLSLLKYDYRTETLGRVTASPDGTCRLFSGNFVGIEVVEVMSFD